MANSKGLPHSYIVRDKAYLYFFLLIPIRTPFLSFEEFLIKEYSLYCNSLNKIISLFVCYNLSFIDLVSWLR